MKLPEFLRQWLLMRLTTRHAKCRAPDFVVGEQSRAYLLRWFVIPRNRFFNIYLHNFLRSDEDRALHDHPWANLSLLLWGTYTEHTIRAGGVQGREILVAGDVKFRRSGKIAHRVELHAGPCWTLFITGPVYRQWGFHCAEIGWRHWREFTAPGQPGQTGKGCDP